MFGFKFLGKTHIPHRKNTKDMPATESVKPSEVLLPLSQHIGTPASLAVSVGDEVKVGQLVADVGGYVSSPIYASVSGKVSKIEDYLRQDGRKVSAVRIVSDGLMTKCTLTPPAVPHDVDSYISAVRSSGVVGLGGAGFPTAVKLDAIKNGKVDTIVFNGAECEPYITADTRAMLDEMELIREGVEMLRRIVLPEGRFIFGIEKNKPECIEAIKELFSDMDSVSVRPLPSLYPQGAEKVLIYNTTGRVVPEGKLPADVGVIVLNVSTLAAISEYIKTGMPLVQRVVTVDGSAVRAPKNVIAPIGTPVGEIIDYVGADRSEIGKLLLGGPMMGSSLCSFDEPIVKTTGAVTALAIKDSRIADATACIHCGRCVSACPMALNPTAFSAALDCANQEERVEILEKHKVNLCMECGCCSYVCPAKRPLVQNNRLGKAEIREYKAHMAALKD